MEDDASDGPSEVIELEEDGLKCAGWRGEPVGAHCWYSTSLAEDMLYWTDRTQLFALNLFSGVLKELSPVDTLPSKFYLLQYIPLEPNYGFLYYGWKNSNDDRLCSVSMVHLDLNKENYCLVGEPHAFRGYLFSEFCSVFTMPNNIFAIPTWLPSSYLLRLFKPNRSKMNFEFRKPISVPRYADWFGMVDEKIVFTVYKTKQFDGGPILKDGYYIDYVATLTDDGSFVKSRNSSLRFPTALFETRQFTFVFSGGWYGRHLFLLHSHPRPIYPQLNSETYLYLFDLDQSKWSHIRAESSPWFTHGCISCKFNDGILSILHYGDSAYDPVKKVPTTSKVELHRLPLGTPEKLHNLAWVKAQKYKLDWLGKISFSFSN